jgi:hypothetical protein
VYVVTESQHLPQRSVKLLRAEVIELSVRCPIANALDIAHLARKLSSTSTGDVEEKLAEGVAGRVAADPAVSRTSLWRR